MKKILGLDLGVASIGWALISEHEEGSKRDILGMGVRIVPLTTDEKDEFAKGNKISKNQNRTILRSQRRGLDRYQQRRSKLKRILEREGMYPHTYLFQLSPLEIYGLRARAAQEKIKPHELGRVLLHLNQRRGYQGTRAEESEESAKKSTSEEQGYVAAVKNRHQQILDKGLTVGQYFFESLVEDPHFRTKNLVFPRKAYLEEFNAIAQAQQLSPALAKELGDQTIYFQRPLKSKKNLVSICQLVGHCHVDNKGVEKWQGPKVAPVSSPIAQVCRVWEHINHLTLKTLDNKNIPLTLSQKQQLFHLFDTKELVRLKDIIKTLGFAEGTVFSDKQLEKGIKGNSTRVELTKILGDKHPELCAFNLSVLSDSSKPARFVDKKSGEVLIESHYKQVTPAFEHQPFYQLWHTIYSIPEIESCQSTLENKFGIEPNLAAQLARIDFTRQGFSNKSARAIRQILPHLMDGHVYSTACALADINHSNSITKEENDIRTLLSRLPLLPKNSLRQPVVEKILNQMIQVVNAVYDEYGAPDEIRVELARELRQSQEERNKTYSALTKLERENKVIRENLNAYNIRATRNNVIKYRLFQEIDGEKTRVNATCIYCGKMFGFVDALRGNAVDVEHIIPQQLRFDDSQSNKTLAHRACNLEKGNQTAYDYMASKSPAEFEAFKKRVQDFYDRKVIGSRKRKNLLTSASELTTSDFINRQLQETRYISKKSREILSKTCREVHSTTGTITEYLRRIWGWNDVLMRLQLPKYKALGLTDTELRQGPDGHLYEEEIIPGWTKRNDHRHHAIDALVVACTQQGFIQRLNSLHAKETRDFLYAQTAEHKPLPGKILERYLKKQMPFTTAEVEAAASRIFISLKPGKKVATKSVFKREEKTRGKNRITGVLTPRGALSESSIYGRIKLISPDMPLKYLFENPHTIVKPYIRELVLERLNQFERNPKTALASLKKDPIYLDEGRTIPLQYGSCYKEEFVIRYPLNGLKLKDVPSIIDPIIREKVRARFEQFGNDEKKAMQGLDENPIWFNEAKRIPIRTVRCLTGLSAVEPLRFNSDNQAIAFVKPGNNHHLAFYRDEAGNPQAHICTFWHAVERKKYGFPVVIEQPKQVWNQILHQPSTYPDSFSAKLPQDNWQFDFSMQQNELFLLGLSDEERTHLLEAQDYAALSTYLYRVQKLTFLDIFFRHHLETTVEEKEVFKLTKSFLRISSLSRLYELSPYKIRLNHLGKIVLP